MRLVRLIGPAVLLLALASHAHAQKIFERSFSTQLFEPAIGLETVFNTESATVADHLSFGLDLMFDYQHKPLVFYFAESVSLGGGGFDISKAKSLALVSSQFTSNLSGFLGLRHKWFKAQVGLQLPINIVLTGNDFDDNAEQTGTFSASGLGDLRLQLKAMLFENFRGFALAFAPILTFPTGNSDDFGGDPNVTFRPRFVGSFHHKALFLALNMGVLIRENTLLGSSEISDRFLYGIGTGVHVHKRVTLLGELSGQAAFSTKSGCTKNPVTGETQCTGTSSNDLDASPLELLLGTRINIVHGLSATAGVGFGLVKAIGSPQFRLLAGLRWAPDYKDTDKDGIVDHKDKCPTQPEDKDGFEDQDGCPDPDNDSDLIPDVRDKCPDEAEDKDSFQDNDGCPDPDNDGDKILDLNDACPFQPETINGFKDKDGCPDVPDMDEDGIPDAKDKCPKEPEDKDGFQDMDGCPDPDNDNDGVPDQFDDCPLAPEDMDKFKDADGCPDPDNDNDGILDTKDKCPSEPETINGYKDADGCPDKGKAQVIIKENKIVIVKKVFFATNKSVIRRRSYSILNQVALVLKANPKIKGVRIEGHTDSSGKKKRNTVLSQARAEAVQGYLIGKGVAAGRLFAIGFGPEKPIANNRTAKGRADNRRVEFIILEQAPNQAAPGAPAK